MTTQQLNNSTTSNRRPSSIICRLPSGLWPLASGFWLLASGLWPLASGFWRLLSKWSVVRGPWSRACVAAICLLLATGCSTPHLDSARESYYLGRYGAAEDELTKLPKGSTDKVLYLMERATMRQANSHYADSTKDWLDAKELAEELDYYSVSRGTTSFAINDRVMAFRGAPYERTLLHAFAAKSYLALALWDDAAVESRNIIDRLENRHDYPDDAYSRYMAGLCMELILDFDAASRQYREANRLTKDVPITNSGHFSASPSRTKNQEPSVAKAMEGRRRTRNELGAKGTELIVFVSIGRSPTARRSGRHNWRWGPNPYAEIYCHGRYQGRSHLLADTQTLLADTEKKRAALRIAKTATRIALKEAAAQVASRQNEFLGELLRVALFAMETPDTRRWETLPRWLQVARVPCPENLTDYKVVFKGENGQVLERLTISKPLQRRGNTFVSFCRVF